MIEHTAEQLTLCRDAAGVPGARGRVDDDLPPPAAARATPQAGGPGTAPTAT
ncbi:MAG TPA: hypothetical protein VE780_04575 [Thermoleophilaceae bacterium]|jgi:hypothetical protein|nr:hypothetical protein [Thermoleophilaceae bacterium]